MATLNLPHPNMDFVPLDILTAAEQNQLVANDAAMRNFINTLANGTGLDDEAIKPSKLDSSKFVLLDYKTTGNAKPLARTFNAPEDCKVKITVSFTGLVKSNANVVARMRVNLDETNIMTFTNATFSGDSEFGMRRSPLGTLVKTADVTAGNHKLTFAENGGWEINDGAGAQVLVERIS